jgi:hypothetical protein
MISTFLNKEIKVKENKFEKLLQKLQFFVSGEIAAKNRHQSKNLIYTQLF